MAEVPRYLSEKPLAIEQAIQAPESLARQPRVDASMAEAMQSFGQTVQKMGKQEAANLKMIARRNQAAIDINAKVEADALFKVAELKLEEFKSKNAPETWEAARAKFYSDAQDKLSDISMSTGALEALRVQGEAKSVISQQALNVSIANANVTSAEINAATALKSAIIDGGDVGNLTAVYLEAGTQKWGEAQAKVRFAEIVKSATAQRVTKLVNEVHGAAEVASESISVDENGLPEMPDTDPFFAAKEMAKNPEIPETQQTALRSTIKTSEAVYESKIKQGKKDLINKTTSDTLRGFYQGSLTVPVLDSLHEKGLVKDAQYKSMREGLKVTAPDDSDPFAAGRIRRAVAQFSSGAISRTDADNIILKDYTLLDGADRATVVVNLEATEEKIIATAKSNAYKDSKSLMSPEFLGVTEGTILRLTKGLSDVEKDRINRRWTAEVNNRDLYERAIDDRFRELQKAGISDPTKYSNEALNILLMYQSRKELGLQELEMKVLLEQGKILSQPKPIDQMTNEEKLRELGIRDGQK